MEKVYCKNCKWNVANFYSLLRYCSPDDGEIGNEFSGSIIKSGLKDKTELNKSGNCPHYQPKWWRRLLGLK